MGEEIKNMETMIYLNEHISQNLVFRDNADKLFDYINDLKKSTVFLDFTEVGFMSRGFAHQYLKNKKITSKVIMEINKGFDARKMLSLVQKANGNKNFIS
ncbi:hypothetical protein KA005_84815 [bacterium]|nr:hypothetical protein [bacterium]